MRGADRLALRACVATPAKEYLQFEAALSLLPGLPPEDAVDLLRQRVQALEMELAPVGRRPAPLRATTRGFPGSSCSRPSTCAALLEAELDFVRTA